MEPIVIRYRKYSVLTLLGLVCIGFGVLAWTEEIVWWLSVLVIAIGFVSSAVFAATVTFTDIFSQNGITRIRLFKTEHTPWNDVIHAGVILVRADDYKPHKEIVFVFRGGQHRENGQNSLLWLIRNRKNALSVQHTDKLEALVSHYYGPLDYRETPNRVWSGEWE